MYYWLPVQGPLHDRIAIYSFIVAITFYKHVTTWSIGVCREVKDRKRNKSLCIQYIVNGVHNILNNKYIKQPKSGKQPPHRSVVNWVHNIWITNEKDQVEFL